MNEKIRVRVITSAGEGIDSFYEFDEGATVADAFKKVVNGDHDMTKFRVRVNRQDQASTYVLKNGDRVSFSPINIKGA